MELLSNALLLLIGHLNNSNPSIHSKEILVEVVLGMKYHLIQELCIKV